MVSFVGAICEDSKQSLAFIENQLSCYFTAEKADIRFDTFCNADALLSEFNANPSKYDIIFLDIEMPGTNGLSAGKTIRLLSENVTIVYITNKDDLVYESFMVSPFRFIRKNHFKEEAPRMVRDYIKSRQIQNTVITFTEAGTHNILKLEMMKISYIEVFAHYCEICYLNHEREKIRVPLKELETALFEYGFLHPYRSFLVNYKYISKLCSNSVIMETGEEIPIGRSLKKDFREAFFARMNG